MELINKIRKSRKGFTLVEIIVVLVILAILAAFTIPTMLGFVNDAKNKAHLAEAREVYVAAQAAVTEEYATHNIVPNFSGTSTVDATTKDVTVTITTANTTTTADDKFKALLGSDLTAASWVVTTDAKGKVTKVEFTPAASGSKKITIENGTTTIAP